MKRDCGRSGRFGGYVGLCLIGLFQTACLEAWTNSGTNDTPIIGGVIDNGDPAVVRMSASDGFVSWGCTGSLIAPRVVLTAAHCVEDANQRTSIEVFFGTDSTRRGGRWEVVEAFSIDPQYNTRRIGDGHDIALLFLLNPVNDVTPVPFNRAPLTQDMRGAPVRIVGFGNTNGWSGTGSGTKRQVTTTLNYWDDGILNVGQTGRATCQGDSGGPTFLLINGVEHTIGTTSFGDFGCPGAAFMSRVDIAAEWIDAQVAMHGGPPVCTPSCAGATCGDDGCGGSCGSCGAGTVCSAGQCVCVPDCSGRSCGDDGCGGSCGTCSQGQCQSDGQCACVANCDGRVCGDDGCGGSCGACTGGMGCSPDGQCTCTPDCSGLSCGDDGCGGSCGSCGAGQACDAGQCVCLPDCSGLSCGDDGCGGSCGSCGPGTACDFGQCVCVPDCSGRSCGDDGCGGSCGSCGSDSVCNAGQCEALPPTTSACDTNGGWEEEPNNNANAASGFCSNGQVYGIIEYSGDVDWYRLSAPAGGRIDLTLALPSSSFGATLHRVSPSGALTSVQTAFAQGQYNIAEIHVQQVIGGDYRLEVFGLNGIFYWDLGYSVQMSVTP